MNAQRRMAVLCSLGLSLSGCVLGPSAIRASHSKYNEAVAVTRDEQLLLNLVRLRYGRSTVFLDLDNVSAQFQFDESAGAAGTINEGPTNINPDVLELGAEVGYAERPTLTYTPLKGGEFVRRMLSRVSLETIALLSQSGWSLDRILRLTVQGLNGLDNASSASGPTPTEAPNYEAFLRVTSGLRELQKAKLIRFLHTAHPAELSDPVPATAVSGDAVVAAGQAGYSFRTSDEGRTFRLIEMQKSPIMVFNSSARDNPKGREVLDLLGLDPALGRYAISLEAGDLSSAAGKRDRLTMDTRSLIGTMFYLSQGVEVPWLHRNLNLVTVTQNADGTLFDWGAVLGDLFQVHCSLVVPTRAAVKVCYKGYWFYIDDTDANSKSTFALLVQLFDLQAGKEAGAAPVLTLPIGG